MSTIEMKSTVPEEDQKNSSSVLTEISNPISFAERTAADFGISVQSFLPASLPSPNRKEKSRLAQLKARRRSGIGVRGSPETNSLIRFIAQQRMKTPPPQCTPELVRKSPFLPRVSSTLRQKMACFQSLMGVEEGEDGTGGRITTRDGLSDGQSLDAGKENHPPSTAVPPNKKRRLGPSQCCEGEITEDEQPPPPLHSSLHQLEHADTVKDKSLQSDKTEEASAQALVVSPPLTEGELPVSPDAQLWSTENQQEVVSELVRIHQPRPDDPSDAAAAQLPSHFHSPSISSLLEMKPSADSLSSPTVRKKKKQVRFGEPLPPELFDRTLPSSTPLQKGGTPARALTPGAALKLRSLLKTPQEADSPSTRQQPELSSPSVFASPTLCMPRCRRMATSEDDREEELSGKIPFPMEEIENEAAIAEESLNARPLKLDTVFNEDSLCHSETECETEAVESVSPMDSLPREPLQEEQEEQEGPQTDTAAPPNGTSSRRGKAAQNTAEAPTRSGGRKRKLPEESEPVKRSSRSAAKTASGKMKASAAARRWNKKVDRSLYGSRAYASKNPSLSPITERRPFRFSFTAEEPEANAAPSLEPPPNLSCDGKSVEGDPAPAAVPHAGDTAAPHASTTPQADGKSGAQWSRRRSGSKVIGRALKERKVSGDGGQDTSEESRAKREEATPSQTVVKHDGGDAGAVAFSDAPTTVKEESESRVVLEEPASFSAGEQFKRASGDVEPGRENAPAGDAERGEGDSATRSRSDEPEDEAATSAARLPPWQDDFNFEDVFKLVPARGQRSVRRSLRNQSSAAHSSSSSSTGGLAWLPHVSPESIKESRRRTRGRRLSAALLTLALEETQP